MRLQPREGARAHAHFFATSRRFVATCVPSPVIGAGFTVPSLRVTLCGSLTSVTVTGPRQRTAPFGESAWWPSPLAKATPSLQGRRPNFRRMAFAGRNSLDPIQGCRGSSSCWGMQLDRRMPAR